MDQVTHTSTATHQPAEADYAGFWYRFLAYSIDACILMIAGFTLNYFLGANPLGYFTARSMADLEQLSNQANTPLVYGTSILLSAVYFITSWVKMDGATIGKKMVGIKIVRENGVSLTLGSAIARFISYVIIGTIGAFCFGLGYFWIVWDKKKQAWHDKPVGTIVIKAEKKSLALPVMIALFGFLLFMAYYAAIFVQSFRIGYQEALKNRESNQSMQQSEIPAGNPHWEKAQALFGQIRTEQDADKAMQIDAEIVTELRLVLAEQPKNAAVWAELGHAYSWVTRLDSQLAEEGLTAYRKAEELEPSNVAYINYVGDQLILMERYDEAVLQLQKTLRLTSKSGYANLSLGNAYTKLKIYDSARQHYTKAIEIFTDENEDGKYDEELLEARKALAELPQ